jgi:DNA polymerase-3 subunit epsilon
MATVTQDLPSKIVFIDVETSGGGPLRDRVIEVGLVTVEEQQVSDTWQSLINPHTRVAPEILSMTGIRPQELETAPDFSQVADEIQSRLEGAVFAAHNARFDFGFIKQEFARLDRRVWWPQLCTVRLSRQLFPHQRRHGLDALIERFGLECKDRHRALSDALATASFYCRLPREVPKSQFRQTVNQIIKQPSLPPAMAKIELERLPQAPGVYLFYGKANELLYVGKSINIRDRVWGHFYQDLESPRELALKNEVTRIEAKVTTGELEALILEARLVKEKQPLFNRRLRRQAELWVARLDQSGEAHRVDWSKTTGLSSTELPEVVGVYRRKNQLIQKLQVIGDKYRLCRKQLGLEPGSGPCFGYHIETCRGVCLGKESPASFNLRLLSALAEIRLPSWPYPGAIGITEESDAAGRWTHIFDNWSYLGTVEEFQKAALPTEGEFELDLYYILRRYLKTCPSSRIRVFEK